LRQKRNKSIALIIEDETDIRKFASLLLALEGLTVVEADTGELGIDIIRRNKCVLVLLDLRLPGRDGWSVLKEIKEDANLCKIPVIVFSASASIDSKEQALMMGAAEYLVKPLSAANLRNSILRVLKSRGSSH
jgi:DNA-binding response OmpR family regulator